MLRSTQVEGGRGSHNPFVVGSGPHCVQQVPAIGTPDSCRLQRCRILGLRTTWRSDMAQRVRSRGLRSSRGGPVVVFPMRGQRTISNPTREVEERDLTAIS